jgi:outer membrane protein assembly factor BamB
MQKRRNAGLAILIGAFLAIGGDPTRACVGDCNLDATVTVDELVRGVNILLDQADLSVCPAIDNSLNGSASVDELVLSVNRLLRGCQTGPDDAVLYSPQGNQLDVYNLVNDRSDVLIPAPRGHVNGQVCAIPDGSGNFILGDDTGQPEVRPGWGIYSPDGTFLQKVPLPPRENEAVVPDPIGCGFDSAGRLFTTAIGSQGGSDGLFIVFFPPLYEESCILDSTIRTPGPLFIDGDAVVVPEAAPPGKILRFAGPFPTSAAECGSVVPTKTAVISYEELDASFAATRAENGHWYVSVVVHLGEDGGATIKEHDADGAFLRDLIAPGTGGNPAGITVASDGTIYYADLGLSTELMPVAGKASVRKITFNDAGDPSVPEVVGRGLTFADAVALLPKRLPESRTFGRSLRRTAYNELEHDITRATAPHLVPKWRYTTGAIITSSPAIAQIDLPAEGLTQVVVVSSWDGTLYALRGEDGSRVWSYAMKPHPGASYPYASSPTVEWVGGRPIVYVGGGMTMYAVDATTGVEVWQFDAGTGCTDCGFDPDNREHRERNELLSSPAVIDGKVFFGIDLDDSGRGKGGMFAVNAADGRLEWYFDLEDPSTCRPLPEDAVRRFDGYHTEEQLGLPAGFLATRPGCDFDRTGTACGNVWSSPAIDARRGLLYIASSNCDTDNDPETADPPPPMPPYDEALFALHFDGTPAWVWRPREVDNADLAFGAVPNLFEVEVDGVVREVVGIGNKDGTYYVLDRDGLNEITGVIEPYWQRTVMCGATACSGPIGGIIGTPSVGEGRVFFSTAIGRSLQQLQKPGTHALNASDGTILWENPTQQPSYGPTAGIPGVVFMGELATGLIHAYNTDDGTELGSIDAKGSPGGVSSLSVVVGGELFTGGGTGARGGDPDDISELVSTFDTPITAFCIEGQNGCPPAPCDDSNPCTYDFRRDGTCMTQPAPNTLSCMSDGAQGECRDGTCTVIAEE